LNYRQRTGCCPIKALSQLQQGIPKASFLDKNNNVNNEQLKAQKALLLLTGQVGSDSLRDWSNNIKRGGASSTFDKRPTIRVKKWNFNNRKSNNNNSNVKGAAPSNNNHLNLRHLFPGEGNIVQKQLRQHQRD
jgi:hypothetical protein